MKLDEAIDMLARVSGWRKTEVLRSPSDALWAASGVLVEARDTIRAAKQQSHPSREKREL